MIKCLSLWQPWATLVALGAKRYETRGWTTGYRGPLAVHASSRWSREQLDICMRPAFRAALLPVVPDIEALARLNATSAMPRLFAQLPLGRVVCVAVLSDVLPTGFATVKPQGPELEFGDFGPGRFAWRLDDVRRLEPPVPLDGRQGLFEIEESLVKGGVPCP